MAENQKGFMTKEMTRRNFLKISGKGLAGFTLSTSMLSLIGASQAEVDSGAVTTWALPQGLLVVNADKCVGCQRCEINCTLVNDGYVSSCMSRVKVTRNLFSGRNGTGMYTDERFTYFPDTCRQCADPACANACPMKAIYADENGVKRIDSEKCVGCGMCTQACPWHMPTVDPITRKSTKCIQCGACAAGCPSGALSIIPWDEVTAASQAV